MKTVRGIALLSVALVLGISACSDKDEPNPPIEGQYLLNVDPRTGADYVTQIVPDLAQGDYNISGATEVGMAWNDMWNINGTVYGLEVLDDGGASNLYKMTLSDAGELSTTATIALDRRGVLYDIGNGQLISIFSGYLDAPEIYYDLIDASTFAVIKSGSFPAELLPNSVIWPNGIVAKENKLYLPYLHCDNVTFESYNEAEALVIDRATMTVEKTITDSRTCALGLDYINGSFVHADGSAYFSTSNTDYWGINESLPAGILRVKAGETDFDEDYFFDVSAAVGGNHNIMLVPTGDGKAITKVFRKDLISEYSDFWEAFCIEFWVLDVVNKTASKLDIPLSRASIHANILKIDEAKYALAANTQSGTFFFIYDVSIGEIAQGAEYTGGNVEWLIEFP